MTLRLDPDPHIAAVILAAGASTRMGRPKLAIPVRGEPMVRRAAQAALASRCREVIVVLGAHADLYQPLLDGLNVRLAQNPDYAEGMGSSLRVGIAAVSPHAAGAVVMLADQPFVSAEMINRLIAAAHAAGRRIAASVQAGTPGPPAYFDRTFFDELRALGADRGARSVIERHQDDLVLLPVEPGAAADVDTPGDLETFDA